MKFTPKQRETVRENVKSFSENIETYMSHYLDRGYDGDTLMKSVSTQYGRLWMEFKPKGDTPEIRLGYAVGDTTYLIASNTEDVDYDTLVDNLSVGDFTAIKSKIPMLTTYLQNMSFADYSIAECPLLTGRHMERYPSLVAVYGEEDALSAKIPFDANGVMFPGVESESYIRIEQYSGKIDAVYTEYDRFLANGEHGGRLGDSALIKERLVPLSSRLEAVTAANNALKSLPELEKESEFAASLEALSTDELSL